MNFLEKHIAICYDNRKIKARIFQRNHSLTAFHPERFRRKENVHKLVL